MEVTSDIGQLIVEHRAAQQGKIQLLLEDRLDRRLFNRPFRRRGMDPGGHQKGCFRLLERPTILSLQQSESNI
jgi:hypothetical protein